MSLAKYDKKSNQQFQNYQIGNGGLTRLISMENSGSKATAEFFNMSNQSIQKNNRSRFIPQLNIMTKSQESFQKKLNTSQSSGSLFNNNLNKDQLNTNTSRRYMQNTFKHSNSSQRTKFRLSLTNVTPKERMTFYDAKHIYSIREYNKLPVYDYTDEQIFNKKSFQARKYLLSQFRGKINKYLINKNFKKTQQQSVRQYFKSGRKHSDLNCESFLLNDMDSSFIENNSSVAKINQNRFNYLRMDSEGEGNQPDQFSVKFVFQQDGTEQIMQKRYQHKDLQDYVLKKFEPFINSQKVDYGDKLERISKQYENILERLQDKAFKIRIPENYKPRNQSYNDYYKVDDIDPNNVNKYKFLKGLSVDVFDILLEDADLYKNKKLGLWTQPTEDSIELIKEEEEVLSDTQKQPSTIQKLSICNTDGSEKDEDDEDRNWLPQDKKPQFHKSQHQLDIEVPISSMRQKKKSKRLSRQVHNQKYQSMQNVSQFNLSEQEEEDEEDNIQEIKEESPQKSPKKKKFSDDDDNDKFLIQQKFVGDKQELKEVVKRTDKKRFTRTSSQKTSIVKVSKDKKQQQEEEEQDVIQEDSDVSWEEQKPRKKQPTKKEVRSKQTTGKNTPMQSPRDRSSTKNKKKEGKKAKVNIEYQKKSVSSKKTEERKDNISLKEKKQVKIKGQEVQLDLTKVTQQQQQQDSKRSERITSKDSNKVDSDRQPISTDRSVRPQQKSNKKEKRKKPKKQKQAIKWLGTGFLDDLLGCKDIFQFNTAMYKKGNGQTPNLPTNLEFQNDNDRAVFEQIFKWHYELDDDLRDSIYYKGQGGSDDEDDDSDEDDSDDGGSPNSDNKDKGFDSDDSDYLVNVGRNSVPKNNIVNKLAQQGSQDKEKQDD